MRAPAVVLVSLLGFVAAPAWTAQAPADPTIREKLEVREVPVLVELPAAWREEPVDRLAARLLALEDGVERPVSALQAVAAPGGPGYSRVAIGFDTGHCQPAVARDAALALAAEAERLVALGPVRVAGWSGAGFVLPSAPSTDAAELAARLTECAPAACMSPALDVPEQQPICPGTPCLMIWVASGWGSGADADAALAAANSTARELAAGGWTVLGLAPVAPPAPK